MSSKTDHRSVVLKCCLGNRTTYTLTVNGHLVCRSASHTVL